MTEEPEEVREEIIPGVARALSPLLRRILVASTADGEGTNTYLVGIDEIAVVDPGPVDPEHLRSITGCGGDCIRWVLCTSADERHAAGALAVKEATGAEILMPAGVKGVEKDRTITPGEVIVGTEFRLTAHAAAGLAPKNLMYFLEEERVLIPGRLMTEDAAVAVAAPGGDVAAYIATLEAAKKLRPKRIAPAAGHVLETPADAFGDHVAHQKSQTDDVRGALTDSAVAVAALAGAIHGDTGENGDLATSTTLAHLELLAADGVAKKNRGKWSLA
jgi:glyoxylase-like metal-dependent hydrolase (beta-lactamase superfamily II)